MLTAAFPQTITASYRGPGGASARATDVANWTVFDILLTGVDTFAADGRQTLQMSSLGLPALEFLYSPQDRLTKVIVGSGLAEFDYTYFGPFAVVSLDGILPVEIELFTPQGQFLAALELTTSGDSGGLLQLINSFGQVVASQPA